jgi:glycosyltransferase involved in cell wall biosynthesis
MRNGILVEPGNAEALAEEILRLYRDPDLRASLCKAGCQNVEEFAMLRVAKRFLRR